MIEILTYILIGLSLSLDAFMMSISYGTIIKNKKEKILLVILIGLFHFVMPIIGTIITGFINNEIIIKVKYIVFFIFLFLIIQMIRDDYDNKVNKVSILTILLSSILVSIDSFSIGVIIGLTNDKIFIASIIFSIISSTTTLLGTNIGNQMTKKSAKISKIIGIGLLIVAAIKYLLFK